MKKILRILGLAGLAVGVLAYPAAFAVDRAAGMDVILVSPRDEAGIAIERFNWESEGSPRAPVHIAEIYGNPFEKGAPTRLVFAKEGNLLRPKEDPATTLYLLRGDDHPLQAMTLWYFALPSTIGGLVAGAVLLWLSCRKGAAPAA